MNYPTITIEGNILSAEILEQLELDDIYGQKPTDYGLRSNQRVKDEIARAWGETILQWQVFQSKKERLREEATGTAETRQFWIVPFLDTLGFRLTKTSRAEVLNGETYDISHVDEEIDSFPVLVMGYRDSLDIRRKAGGPRLSPHALLQEYLNLTEHLYGIVTNGHRLRLLRDSSRLTRLSYLEFDLEGMMETESYADFAILFRLLHRTRMPQRQDEAGNSIVEHYHQDALESGARIRDGLSRAVEDAIRMIGSGLLSHNENVELRRGFANGEITPQTYFTQLLRVIYRLLFLFVVEERDLVFPREENIEAPDTVTVRRRDIYNRYYAASRLLRIAEQLHLVDGRSQDMWIGLFNTFQLFESEEIGSRLGISALDGELFGVNALDHLIGTSLGNDMLLQALDLLGRFRNDSGDWVRINYAALNVEEFGSVYEGLLDLAPRVESGESLEFPLGWSFGFVAGDERGNTGSHYTPDELVRPLVEHALDPVIEGKIADAKKRKDTEAIEGALLSLKVCDVACGSGHFLLAAARRIAYVLARTRTGEEQPNPAAMRVAVRDVIAHCIYGVDKNPMAAELCRVALWLEAHNPGKPLTFLDHRIKCGDAIVGVARPEDLDRGIPDEAFAATAGDDKSVASAFRKRNKAERTRPDQFTLDMKQEEADTNHRAATEARRLNAMPDSTISQRQAKQQTYSELRGTDWLKQQKQLADLITAQFFLPKTTENAGNLCTEADYRSFRETPSRLDGSKAAAAATGISAERRFFHWFLEFPEVFDEGGFDCVLGNPPFLGGKKLSTVYGNNYLECLKVSYPPASAIDLVGFFFRRIFTHLYTEGSLGCIATNTLAQGSTREGSLAVILDQGGSINYAIRSMKWPGRAGVEVALMTLHKEVWKGKVLLDGKEVDQINSYLSDDEPHRDPFPLESNDNLSFVGSYVLGMGFVLEKEQAAELIAANPKNRDVLFPYLNGEDLNSQPDQSASRWVINFFDWPEIRAEEYRECYRIIENLVKPERQRKKDDDTFQLRSPLPERWWQYADKRPQLYRTIAQLRQVLVVPIVTKYVSFIFASPRTVFSHRVEVMAFDDWIHFSLLQSDFHLYWARYYSSTLGGMSTVNYSASKCFESYPFPQIDDQSIIASLESIGNCYYSLRAVIMHRLQIGLTKTYNLFHLVNLTVQSIIKAAKCDEATATQALDEIKQLRQLHAEMDEVVKAAYGWNDLALEHDFHEVEFLPENDRVRFTISREARREVLRRLLLLNHERYAEEQREKENAPPAQSRRMAKKVRLIAKEEVEHEMEHDEAILQLPEEMTAVGIRQPEPSKPELQLIPEGGKKREASLAFRRGILGCELVYMQGGDWTLAKRKMMKQLRLIELESKKPISENITRAAAGPYDSKLMFSIKSQLEQRGVRLVKGSRGQHFAFTARAPKHDEYFASYWSDAAPVIDRIVKLTQSLRTYEISLVGTLYEAWNDLLIAGIQPTDDAIINESTVEWHPEKQKIPREEWLRWLQWMRDNELIPAGIVLEKVEPTAKRKVSRSKGKRKQASKNGSSVDIIESTDVVLHVCAVVREQGRIDREALIRAVAIHMGYQRTGGKIRERVEAGINDCVGRGVIVKEGGGYVLGNGVNED